MSQIKRHWPLFLRLLFLQRCSLLLLFKTSVQTQSYFRIDVGGLKIMFIFLGSINPTLLFIIGYVDSIYKRFFLLNVLDFSKHLFVNG